MLVDSHCHLDYYVEADIADVIARAKEAGIGRMVTIGTRFAQAVQVKALTERFDCVLGTVGIHPHNVGEGPLPSAEALATLADHPRIIGLGESGLDYFYDKAPRDAQAESFRNHIRAAQLTSLPLAIHARQADEDIASILAEERERGGAFPFLLHCFSGGRALAQRAVAMGGYVSFSGILTFPKSDELRDIARDIPSDRLLVETDAPFLAPVPFRGKLCEPAMVAHTAKVLASVRGMEIAALEALTTCNFETLFKKAA
ncbi:MAG: TatD family deoxyribonuclease [Alphaproteobacteria bacterium]|nr:TatD family deoxyribonuclease [Alphaproteobacteria bacterium]